MTETTQDKAELSPEQAKTRKKLFKNAVVFDGQLNAGNVYIKDSAATNGRCAQYDVINAWGEVLHGVALCLGGGLVTAMLRGDPKQIKWIIRQWLNGETLEVFLC